MDTIKVKESIQHAAESIQSDVVNTPILQSQYINDKYSVKVIFKCENFQRTGSFKFRGALYGIKQSIKEDKDCQFCGHSSGNFAQALAMAAKINQKKATVFMPQNAPQTKVDGVRYAGGEIVFTGNTIVDRENAINEFLTTHKNYKGLHPSNDYSMIIGNATITLEMLSENSDLDMVIVPVGGGGILAGTALAAHHFAPHIKVYGAEPSGAADAVASLATGLIQPSIQPQTIADGLRTQLGDVNFPIIQRHVTDILTVDDDETIMAMKDVYQYLKIVIEPSSALPLALIKKYPKVFANKRIGIIITGGNLDLINLAEIFK
ncbi:threonine ammonia-lyase [Membranihabitans marinus]|uniref:threonine ammonia-lyase n=1 Tax=Membranihabitans marinus TaxID=1227546 RepID=UPI001F22FCB1|nr:threonine/serine dehydratase [Membranihabitans marinus]